MFGLNPWMILGAGIAFAVATGGAYLKGHSNGTDKERAKWEIAIAKQKIDAAALLAAESAKVIAKERELTALSNQIEVNHAKAIADLDAAGSKYNRLGKLFEQQRSRCGFGGGSANGSTTPTASVDRRGDNPGGDVPDQAVEGLGDIARDADRLRENFRTCQEYVRALPAAVNR